MNKVIRDGKVAVLISCGYGAGFGSWGGPIEAIFDPKLVELIESEDFDGAVKYVETTYPGATTFGIIDLQIAWIDEGEEFTINEYDGYESIQLKSKTPWLTA
jgi:hypothetical protein